MYVFRQTQVFHDWLDSLKDKTAQVRIAARLRQIELGNLGDWKSVGANVSELRVNVGPAYRLYFTRRKNVIIIMLAGGDKSSQKRDIERAKRLVTDLEKENEKDET